MFATEQLEDLARKLYSVLPSSLQNIDEELQKQFQDILHFAFLKLDLVTREEFDVQTKVLARTRDKIENLEKELAVIIKKTS
jgi:BMFP domain-containing protein YqiC